jgi:hypothetical protein
VKNFKITVTGLWPWPFSWGPFQRVQARVLRGNEFLITVWQRNRYEPGNFTHLPLAMSCSSTPLEAKTVCENPACGSKKSAYLIRRTKI